MTSPHALARKVSARLSVSTWRIAMQELAIRETADRSYAAMAASNILSQFVSLHGMPVEDKKLALKWLTERLTGEQKSVVSRMADMSVGLAATEKFYSLAAVNKWFENFGPQPAWKPFKPEPEWTPPTREERDACLARARAVQEVLRETTEKMRTRGKIVGKRAPAPSQIDCPVKRQAALETFGELDGPLPVPHRSSA
jgi:hypothetical protein